MLMASVHSWRRAELSSARHQTIIGSLSDTAFHLVFSFVFLCQDAISCIVSQTRITACVHRIWLELSAHRNRKKEVQGPLKLWPSGAMSNESWWFEFVHWSVDQRNWPEGQWWILVCRCGVEEVDGRAGVPEAVCNYTCIYGMVW